MPETKLQISPTCAFVRSEYGDPVISTDVDLEYTEHSTDHWHRDSETSLTINRETAIQIVEFLTESFKL